MYLCRKHFRSIGTSSWNGICLLQFCSFFADVAIHDLFNDRYPSEELSQDEQLEVTVERVSCDLQKNASDIGVH